MEARATLRYARVSPSKVRQVVQNIRDLPVAEARQVLELETKPLAREVRKVLDSAVANAEHNFDLDPDDLSVVEVVVNEGPTLRRFRPRAMGRATRIRKRTSHITIVVGDDTEPVAPAGASAAPQATETPDEE